MKSIRLILLTAVAAIACASFSTQAADKTPLTPEFCEEGIQKAIEVFDEMTVKINEIEEPEQVLELEKIFNSIKFRNVRKKYGKIELTDEYRERLLESNLKIAKALSDMIVRLQLPYQVQQMLDEQSSPEKLREAFAEAKTLRDVMQ